MDLILEGQLSATIGMREVLQTLLKRSAEATGILRVASPRKNLNGRLALLAGKFIVGAQITDTDQSGYEAVKSLLSVTDGNFAFLATDDKQALDLGKKLHISLPALMSRFPDLPESSAELFDEKSLLDEVFYEGKLSLQSQSEEDTEILPAEPEAPAKPAQSDPAWRVLSSLMQQESPAGKAQGPILGRGSRTPSSNDDWKHSTFSRIKAVRLGGRPVLGPILWIAGLLVLGLFLWLVYSIIFH